MNELSLQIIQKLILEFCNCILLDLDNFQISTHVQLIVSELQINFWESLRSGATKELES